MTNFTKAELQGICTDKGIDFKKSWKKSKLIEAIQEYNRQESYDDYDEDENSYAGEY